MIKINNIEKSYNGEKVLKGINLTINDGDFVTIMGRSGSGKSTLLKIIGGFLTPDNGEVYWDNNNIYNFSDKEMSYYRSNYAGFVFQEYNLISTLSVKDNILLPSSLSKQDKKIIDENYNYLIRKLNIENIINKYPDELSGGQMQRVGIARALLYSPKVIFLDEPTGALDSINEKIVMDLLKDLNKNKKLTVVSVTHSKFVSSYGTKIINVLDGNIVNI